MKPAKIFALLIVLISAILVYFMSSKKGTLENELKNFVIEDTASINKIKLIFQNKTLLLEKSENNWKINNSYIARNEAIYSVLKVFNQLQIQSTVPNSKQDSVLKSFEKNSFQVEISGKFYGSKVFKISNLANNSGSYFLAENSENPLILYVPGMNKNLTTYFSINPAFWRSKIVFDYLPSNLKSVELNFPSENEKSFKITNDKQLELFDFHKKKIDNFSLENGQNYFSLFRKIEYKNLIEPSVLNIKSFVEKEVFAIIEITNSQNNKNTLKLFQKFNDKNEIDLNVLYGIQNNETLFEITYFALDPILKEKNDFIK